MKPSASSKARRWKKWFHKVNTEISVLVACELMRKQFWHIVAQSPIRNESNPLIGYFSHALTNEIIIKIGKICEKQNLKNKKIHVKSVFSLIALLEEFKDYSSYFNRKRLLRIITKTTQPVSAQNQIYGFKPLDINQRKTINNNVFDFHVGKNKDSLSSFDIQKDITSIEKEIAHIKKIRDKFIAHNDLRQKTRKSTLEYKKIDKSIYTISRIANKYHFLLTGISIHTELYRPGEVSILFLKPWINSEEQRWKLEEEFKKMAYEFKSPK